jgi:putative sterol carrier protein
MESEQKRGKMDNQESGAKDRLLPDALQLKSVMQKTIELLGRKLNSEQIKEIAQVFQTLCWNFKDYDFQGYLLLDEHGQIRYLPSLSSEPDATITLSTSTLHDAAYGKTTFGTAFVMGKLKVKGISALKLRNFIPLLKPFLESYREAWEAFHE